MTGQQNSDLVKCDLPKVFSQNGFEAGQFLGCLKTSLLPIDALLVTMVFLVQCDPFVQPCPSCSGVSGEQSEISGARLAMDMPEGMVLVQAIQYVVNQQLQANQWTVKPV